ncbi:phosphoribosylglycinamide formyltransferase [archaeon]|nr:phosphoribosylglycinamide formyltransferase [archaeon]MBT4352771.1 phosphoribosylglycinamide formyltransferase [archaeon]MBT4647719.1 phosphoribosylglycinamide formyltransferase [archaeon]MBT7392405.1 phosphoribosylglycinamide formyltransferase [archaeon]
MKMSNNIAILASTRGTDMQAIIDAIESKELDAKITVMISNKEDCYALERARTHNLKGVFVNPKLKTREEYDEEISKLLEENEVDLILLIGYMKLMSDWFVQKYRNRVMNIHPSLLPAFAGDMDVNVHEAVLERGCKYTGASLIFIDEGADTGPIILQKLIKVENDDNVDSLKDKVQIVEQELFLEAIPLYFEGRLIVEGKRVFIE